MAHPQIQFDANGEITVCCGDQCVTVTVQAKQPNLELPPIQVTPFPPALSLRAAVNSMASGRPLGHLGAGALHLDMESGDQVALDVLHRLAEHSGRTPIVNVRAVSSTGPTEPTAAPA